MILLDTHAVLWLMLEPERLTPAAREKIATAAAHGEPLCCSVLSLYEIVHGMLRGRIRLQTSMDEFLRGIQRNLTVLPVPPEVAIAGGALGEDLPGDPMDRMIIATALAEKCVLVTADARIRQAKACPTLW